MFETRNPTSRMKTTPALLAALGLLLGPALRSQEESATAPEPTRPPQNERAENPDKGKKPRPPKPGAKRPDKPVPGKTAQTETAKRTWMGLATRPVEPALREHLDIPEGFGIQIVQVVPESPAEKAGLLANDIILRLDDQRLISPEHLSLLVRSHASGDSVPLTLIRKGQEKVVEVVLGEADDLLFGNFTDPHVAPQLRGMPEWNEEARRQQDFWREWMERNRPEWRQGNPGRGDRPEDPGILPPGASAPGLKVNPGFPLRVFGTQGVLKIDNEKGELTLTRQGEDHHLVIEDADGKVIYEGAYDPKTGVEGLPEEAREQLDKMKLGDLEIRLPEAPPVSPKKTVEPEPGDPESGSEVL